MTDGGRSAACSLPESVVDAIPEADLTAIRAPFYGMGRSEADLGKAVAHRAS